MQRRDFLLGTLAGSFAATQGWSQAWAQGGWPSVSRFIVPFAPGGALDLPARRRERTAR